MKRVGVPDIEILNCEELKAWFVDQYLKTPAEFRVGAGERCTPVYVSSKVRREYLLQHKNLLMGGRFYNIEFKDMKGGVWLASVVEEMYVHMDWDCQLGRLELKKET